MGLPRFDTVEITSVACATVACATRIIMPADVMRQFRDSHRTFYCYHGHDNYFPYKSDAEKLKAQLAEMTKSRDNAVKSKEWAQQAEKKAEYQRRAAKGQLTKTKNRIKNGVCPCCKRTFTGSRLAAHMKTKHPGYGE